MISLNRTPNADTGHQQTFQSIIQSMIHLMGSHHAKYEKFVSLISQNGLLKISNPEMAYTYRIQIDGFVQDCNISIASALEILQSCSKLSRSYKIYDGTTYTVNVSISAFLSGCQTIISNLNQVSVKVFLLKLHMTGLNICLTQAWICQVDLCSLCWLDNFMTTAIKCPSTDLSPFWLPHTRISAIMWNPTEAK